RLTTLLPDSNEPGFLLCAAGVQSARTDRVRIFRLINPSLFPENQVCYASLYFFGRAESDHISSAGGRNEIDHLVVNFVSLHKRAPSRSLALLLIQCTSSASDCGGSGGSRLGIAPGAPAI